MINKAFNSYDLTIGFLKMMCAKQLIGHITHILSKYYLLSLMPLFVI